MSEIKMYDTNFIFYQNTISIGAGDIVLSGNQKDRFILIELDDRNFEDHHFILNLSFKDEHLGLLTETISFNVIHKLGGFELSEVVSPVFEVKLYLDCFDGRNIIYINSIAESILYAIGEMDQEYAQQVPIDIHRQKIEPILLTINHFSTVLTAETLTRRAERKKKEDLENLIEAAKRILAKLRYMEFDNVGNVSVSTIGERRDLETAIQQLTNIDKNILDKEISHLIRYI
jgi:hypothetical protein